MRINGANEGDEEHIYVVLPLICCDLLQIAANWTRLIER